MTIKSRMIEEFSFTSEDNLAGACSSALRKVRSLADTAPIGRLFASIATLSDMSNQIGQSLALMIFQCRKSRSLRNAHQHGRYGNAAPLAFQASRLTFNSAQALAATAQQLNCH
jgi:hypothetical protein